MSPRKEMIWIRWALAIGGVALLGVACVGDTDSKADVTVFNRTDKVLSLSFVSKNETIEAGSIAAQGVETLGLPLEIRQVKGGQVCAQADFVARTSEGTVYEELPGPICRPAEWVIGPGRT